MQIFQTPAKFNTTRIPVHVSLSKKNHELIEKTPRGGDLKVKNWLRLKNLPERLILPTTVGSDKKE